MSKMLEYPDGTKIWYQDINIHREDGPAIVFNSGKKHWYLNNKKFTKQEFNKFIAKKRIGKLK